MCLFACLLLVLINILLIRFRTPQCLGSVIVIFMISSAIWIAWLLRLIEAIGFINHNNLTDYLFPAIWIVLAIITVVRFIILFRDKTIIL